MNFSVLRNGMIVDCASYLSFLCRIGILLLLSFDRMQRVPQASIVTGRTQMSIKVAICLI
jgi:hypothetical protein